MKQDIKDISEKEFTKLYAEYLAGLGRVPYSVVVSIARTAAFRVACRLKDLRLGNPG